MKRAENIHNELNELGAGVLMSLPPIMPFSTPEGHFESFNAVLMQQIATSVPESELTLPSGMPFAAPSPEYFTDFSKNILAKIQGEALDWGKGNPYSVPYGYFEQFPARMTQKAKASQTVRRRIPLFHTVRLAAAMALIFFVGFGVMKMNHFSTPENGLTSLSKAEINQYVAENIDDFDTDLILNTLAKNETKSDAAINLTDAEIKAYLDEAGWN